jgi:hypothetical protein
MRIQFVGITRKAYPSDISDDEWAVIVAYLTLLPEASGQGEHSLREIFNGLRYVVRNGIPWRAMPNDPAVGCRPSTGEPLVQGRVLPRACT